MPANAIRFLANVAIVRASETSKATGTPTAVVSMPSRELFAAHDASWRAAVPATGTGTVRVGREAALRFGWHRWLGERGGFVGMTGFGACGPADVLYLHFGITPEAIVAEANRVLAVQPESATP